MKHVVIYGPQACGKTRNKAALAKAYGCGNIVDEAGKHDLRGRIQHSQKTLFLTVDRPHRINPAEFELVPFAEAMRTAGLQP